MMLASTAIFAQAARESSPAAGAQTGEVPVLPADTFPLRRLSLFSSGVGYFEHSGTVGGPAEITITFPSDAVNDALKSLVINDPASASPQVSYPASDTLSRTLKSFKIDLSGNPGIGDILRNLRGEEIVVAAPNQIRGRIVAVENRRMPPDLRAGLFAGRESYLSLAADKEIRVINIADIESYSFIDPVINANLNRALNILRESQDNETRSLTIRLGGNESRIVSLSYVIPQAVWKVSYRLELSDETSMLQGWAIIDNDSDADWIDVELSLTTGRPSSFIQDLYSPYRLTRPVLPLSIAGTAEARTYESGIREEAAANSLAFGAAADAAVETEAAAAPLALRKMAVQSRLPFPSPRPAAGAGAIDDSGSHTGDFFEFTLQKPVTLARRQSATLPVAEGSIAALKTLIFSGERAAVYGTINPAAGAEITNTTGMKLPAGPVTVYNRGTYAGDALVEFLPEGEKRLISYGEDLTVTGGVSSTYSRAISAVTISKGIMKINRKQRNERVYTIRNAAGEAKRIVVEHPITPGAALAEPAAAEEKTNSLYRFTRELPANGSLAFTVREETPVTEELRLVQIRPETFAAWIADGEISASAEAQTALDRAVELKGAADKAAAALTEIEARSERFTMDQDRIRRNLEAAGNQTTQGQEYLRRLAALDSEIDALSSQFEETSKTAKDAQTAYEDYLNGLEF
jgi:hypothetical protein